MATLTKIKLMTILTNRLHLKEPDYLLEKVGNRWVGDVISSSFKGKRDHQRQKMIWDALEAELGEQSNKQVGMLLAYTPDEWNLGVEIKLPKRKVG